VFTLQMLPAFDGRFDDGVGKVAEFSLHAGVAARADRPKKLELADVSKTDRRDFVCNGAMGAGLVVSVILRANESIPSDFSKS
jgi:hypothetical protein